MKKVLIVLYVDNMIDIITNSSSELFVLKANSIETIEEMLSTVYPNYLDEYDKVKHINDLSDDELDTYIGYQYCLWDEKLYYDNKLPGFTFDDIYEDETYADKIYKSMKPNFISDNREKILDIIDPKRTMYFLFSSDENPSWEMQELLMDIGERYHLG